MPAAAETLPAFLRDAAARAANHVLFKRPAGDVVTYGTACRWVAAIAARLQELGLGPGSFLVTFGDDTIHTALLDLACPLAGVVPAPLAPSFSTGYLQSLCAELGTRWVVASPALAPELGKLGLSAIAFEDAPGLPSLLPGDPELSLAQALDRITAGAAGIDPDALFMVQPTSGSTGAPKLVMRTHRGFSRYARFVGRELAALKERPRFLAVNALTHAFGLHMLATATALGAEIDVPTALDTAASLQEVRALDPNVLPMTPRVLRALYRQALETEWAASRRQIFGPSARFLFSAGGKSDAQLLRTVADTGISVVEWYGSSEASIVSLTPADGWRHGYAGRVVDDTTVRVAPDGELLVRSPGLMLGYYGAAALTRESLTDDGFYRTGDLGEVADDGYLRVLGRKRDVFNTPEGSNIYPERIEMMIEAVDGVEQVMLVGDQCPFLVAFIVLAGAAVAEAGRAPGTIEADGVIGRDAAPALYDRFERALEAMNDQLELIERVRRFVLLATPFPTGVYAVAGPAKVRRDRRGFLQTFAARIAELYEMERTVFGGAEMRMGAAVGGGAGLTRHP